MGDTSGSPVTGGATAGPAPTELVPAAEKGWNVILYHYSAGEYLHAIAKHGLTVGDVPTNIMAGLGRFGLYGFLGDHPGGNCLGGSAIDKSRFRFAVEVTPEDLFGKMDGLARTQRDGTNDRVSRAFERCDAAELVGLFRLDQRYLHLSLLIQAPSRRCTPSATLLDFANVPTERLLFLRRRR